MDRARRYKSKGLQFSSAEDSRALRAVDARMGRKAQRDAMFSRRRMDGCETATAKSIGQGLKNSRPFALGDVSTEFPNKTAREQELQRYEQLLKWKAERRKQLNVEKRSRKPSFKTGVFQPDQPKFLVSDDVQPKDSDATTPAKPPPFKYLQRSSTKYGFTPGLSSKKVNRICSGVTPSSSVTRVPKFNLRTTPSQSLVKTSILQKKYVDQKENLHNNVFASKRETGDQKLNLKKVREMDMKRVIRSRITRKQMVSLESEELGVKALPATPIHTERRRSRAKPQSTTEDDNHLSETRSFAPGNFSFNFVAAVKDTEAAKDIAPELTMEDKFVTLRDAEPIKDVPDLNMEDNVVPQKDTELAKDDAPEQTMEDNFVTPRQSLSTASSNSASQKSFTREVLSPVKDLIHRSDKMEEELLEKVCDEKDIFRHVEKLEECGIGENVAPISEGADKKVEKDILRETKQEESVDITYMSEVDDKGRESWTYNNKDLHDMQHNCHLNEVENTPVVALRKSARRSTRLSACLDTTLSPTMSKLRPRTPCSRSTRRSMSAHTDFMIDHVPTPKSQSSLRRSTRRSLVKRLKSDAQDLAISLDFETSEPVNSVKSNELPTTEVSESTTVQEDVIEEENETEILPSKKYESPNPEMRGVMQTPNAENLITPRTSVRKLKVSWVVKESPNIDREKRSAKKRSVVPSDISSMFDDIPTDGSPLPDYLLEMVNRVRLEQGQSPILSKGPASFPQSEDPDISNIPLNEDPNISSIPLNEDQDVPMSPEQQTCSSLLDLLKPSSPVRNDTPDVDVWGEESPKNNDKDNDPVSVVSADESRIILNVPPPPVTRRSCRISLLPGLTDTPGKEKLSTVSEDLISWETPILSAKKSKKIDKDKPKATPSRRSRRLSKAYLE